MNKMKNEKEEWLDQRFKYIDRGIDYQNKKVLECFYFIVQ